MPKVTNIWIQVSENGEKIEFETPVNVTKEGVFTTTLPQNAVRAIEEYGVQLRKNRIGNPGYFEAKTLDELKADIRKTCREALSRELVEDHMVIKYEIRTDCYYCKDKDGTIVPNGGWLKEPIRNYIEVPWVKGTGNQNFAGTRTHTPAISVWAGVYHKKKYTYSSGKEKVELERYFPKQKTDNPLDWINSLDGITFSENSRQTFAMSERETAYRLNKLPEVEATEKNAKFFVTMFKLIFKMNELFAGFSQPELLLEYLKKNDVNKITF